jgi:hypothetical protein
LKRSTDRSCDAPNTKTFSPCSSTCSALLCARARRRRNVSARAWTNATSAPCMTRHREKFEAAIPSLTSSAFSGLARAWETENIDLNQLINLFASGTMHQKWNTLLLHDLNHYRKKVICRRLGSKSISFYRAVGLGPGLGHDQNGPSG